MKKTIFDIYKEKGKIFEGIKNSIFTNDHVEEIASQRMDICNSCPFLDIQGVHCYVPGTKPCCSECGCSLKFKTRSLSSECPKNFWNAILTEDEENKLNDKLNNQ